MKTLPDSLINGSVEGLEQLPTDTLTAPLVKEPVRPLLDSLWGGFLELPDTLQRSAESLQITALEAFGPASRLVVATREVLPFRESLTDHPIFQGIILLLAVAYALMVCAHLHEIVAGFDRIRSGEVRPGGNSQAVHTSAIIGLLLVAALAVRLCEGGLGEIYGTMSLLLAALTACVGITLFQCGLLLLIGRTVLMSDLAEAVVGLKILHYSVGTLILTPFMLLLLLCPPERGIGWFVLLLVMGGIVILHFAKETFRLFMAKKVSILHWFLYLCTVECFPISLVWLLAVRW